jgi:hypothetical protein
MEEGFYFETSVSRLKTRWYHDTDHRIYIKQGDSGGVCTTSWVHESSDLAKGSCSDKRLVWKVGVVSQCENKMNTYQK